MRAKDGRILFVTLFVGSCIGIATASVAQAPAAKVSPDPIEDVPPTLEDPSLIFHDYSWRSFIALNWPAMAGASNRGQPDRSKSIEDLVGPRVWMTWKSRHEIFQPNGVKPSDWTSFDGANPCGSGFTNDGVTLSSFSAFGDFNQAAFSLTTLSNPLVAQNRTYVRYEVRVNQNEFETIKENEWYKNSKLPKKETAKPFKIGSTEIKAAWRILNDRDDSTTRARYFVVSGAQVFDVISNKCESKYIALVGFHIVTKTASRPQWIWSSFEHVDNVPPKTTEPHSVSASMSFNNPKGPAGLDPATSPKPVSTVNLPVPDPNPMQVVRLRPIQPEAMEVNERYWQLPHIKDTVWQNYMLVMTQWPTNMIPESPDNSGKPFPSRSVTLSNTTMETYFQNDFGTCMNCHHVSNRNGRDFVMFVTIDAFKDETLSPGDLFSNQVLSLNFDKKLLALEQDPFIQDLAKFVNAAKNEK